MSSFEFLLLPILYRRGPNKWHDQFLPVEILDDWIKAKGLAPAQWASDGKSVTIGDQEYSLSHFGNLKRLCMFHNKNYVAVIMHV